MSSPNHSYHGWGFAKGESPFLSTRFFHEWGVEVHELYPNVSVKRETGGLEIDLLVVNDTEAILIEVKSKWTKGDASGKVC